MQQDHIIPDHSPQPSPVKDRLGLLFAGTVNDARSSCSSRSPSPLSARAAVSPAVIAFFSINSASISGGSSDSALAAELLAGDISTAPSSTAAAVALFAAAAGFAFQVLLADALCGTALAAVLKVAAGFASTAAVAASGRFTLSPAVSVGEELA